MTSSTLGTEFGGPAPLPSIGAIARATSDRRMRDSRIIGALFLLGFAFYGTGFAMVSSVVGAPDFLTNIAANRMTLAIGAVLMMLPIITDVWRAVVFFPILGEAGKSTAFTYLAAQIVSVVMFFVGALSLLLIIPLGPFAADVAAGSAGWASAMGGLLVQSNQNAYQVAQASLAFGSLSLWAYGFRARLIPRAFAGWALLGYVFLLGGAVAELLGFPISMMMQIPGALFEITLPFWLFFKGFGAEAYGKGK